MIRFIEMGCPAVDKGKSYYPYFSTKARDDAILRAWLEAMIGYYTDASNNPVSTLTGARMIELSRSFVWAWDARPWPSFPLDDTWGDAGNWETGHWISGRLGTAPASDTIRQILEDAGFVHHQVEAIGIVVDGITTGTLASARGMLDALRPVFQFDAVESEGLVKFVSRLSRLPVATLQADELVGDERRFMITRGQETELPDAVKMKFGDPTRDDQPAATEARRSAGGSRRVLEYGPPAIMSENLAKAICEYELHSAWTGRERVTFQLPPSRLALDPGDSVHLAEAGGCLRVADVADGIARSVNAVRFDPLALTPVLMPQAARPRVAQELQLPANVVLVDGPMLADDHVDHAGYVGGIMLPFAPGIAVYRSAAGGTPVFDAVLDAPAVIGVTTADLRPGPLGIWDPGNVLELRLYRGQLSSAGAIDVLNGANALMVENAVGEWEVLQFASANLIAPRTGRQGGVVPSVQVSILTANAAGLNVATAQPVFPAGQSEITPEAGTTYAFEAEYAISRSAGTTSHTTGLLFGGTATLTSIGYMAQVTNPTGNVLASVQQVWRAAATLMAITAANTSATENLNIVLKGTVRTGDAGTFIPQFQYSAAPGGAPAIKANSAFRIWPIGVDTLTSAGQWG